MSEISALFPGGSDGKATVRETRVQSLGQEDPLEKEMATHSITLAWKIPWTEECSRLQSMGSQRVGHELVTEQQAYIISSSFLIGQEGV